MTFCRFKCQLPEIALTIPNPCDNFQSTCAALMREAMEPLADRRMPEGQPRTVSVSEGRRQLAAGTPKLFIS